MRNTITVATLFICFLNLISPAISLGDVVINGSFEEPSDPPLPGSFVVVNPGDEGTLGFTGWSLTAGNVDVVDISSGIPGVLDWSSFLIDGPQVLDLNGTPPTQTDVAGAITQNFATTAGTDYSLSFWYANNPIGSSGETASVNVIDENSSASLLSQSIAHSTSSSANPEWVLFSNSFAATGPLTRLTFASTSNPNDPSGGIIIDGVSVSAIPNGAVPGESLTVAPGIINSGGLPDLEDSDNVSLVLFRDSASTAAVTQFVLTATSPTTTPTSFEFVLEGRCVSRPNVVQRVEFFNYVTGAFETVDEQNAVRMPPDLSITVTPAGDLSRFVDPSTGEILARVRYRADSPRASFSSRTDQAIWMIE